MQPRISIIMAVRDGVGTVASALHSALSQTGVPCEVIVVDDDSHDGTAAILEAFSYDPRVTVISNLGPVGGLGSCRQAIEAALAPHVLFLEATDVLERDGCLTMGRALADSGLPMALGVPTLEGRERLTGTEAIAAIFQDGTLPDHLGGVMVETELAREALADLPSLAGVQDFGMVVLFALCLHAKGLVALPSSILRRTRPMGRESSGAKLTVEGVSSLCRDAASALAVGRVISNRGLWDRHRASYQALASRLMGRCLTRFPGEVEEGERGAAFDAIASAWPASELVAGIAQWNGHGLLHFLEAARDSAHLSAPNGSPVERVAILVDGEVAADQEGLVEALTTCRQLGVHPKVLTCEPLVLPAGLAPVIDLPRWDGDEPYFERAHALARALGEQDVDAVVAPISQNPSLPFDLLLARLCGCGVALMVPEDLRGILDGASEMARSMTLCQVATVVAIARSGSRGFWSMASHSHVVAAQDCGSQEEFWSRILDELENPMAPKVTMAQPPLARNIPSPFASLPPNPAPAETDPRGTEELMVEIQVLRQKLAAAQDEARSLREQLVASGKMPLILPHVGPLIDPETGQGSGS